MTGKFYSLRIDFSVMNSSLLVRPPIGEAYGTITSPLEPKGRGRYLHLRARYDPYSASLFQTFIVYQLTEIHSIVGACPGQDGDDNLSDFDWDTDDDEPDTEVDNRPYRPKGPNRPPLIAYGTGTGVSKGSRYSSSWYDRLIRQKLFHDDLPFAAYDVESSKRIHVHLVSSQQFAMAGGDDVSYCGSST